FQTSKEFHHPSIPLQLPGRWCSTQLFYCYLVTSDLAFFLRRQSGLADLWFETSVKSGGCTFDFKLQLRIGHLKQARVECWVSKGNFFPFVPRYVFLSTLPALWDYLSESRDGNRRPFESAIHTLGQRRIRREFKWQRSARSYLP